MAVGVVLVRVGQLHMGVGMPMAGARGHRLGVHVIVVRIGVRVPVIVLERLMACAGARVAR